MEHLRAVAIALALAAHPSLLAGTARADDSKEPRRVSARTATLVYDLGPTKACPDEASFRNLVAARIGSDPFVAESPTSLRVRIRARGHILVGNAELVTSGSQPRARELTSREGCDALVAALAATVAFSLDPSSGATRPADEPAAAPAPAEPPATSPLPLPPPDVAPAPIEPPRPAPAIVPILAVGAGAAAGVAPSVTVGGELGIGLRRSALSLVLQGRFDTLPARAILDSGIAVELTLLGVALLPCGTVGYVRLCAVARGGVAQGRAVGTDQHAPQGSAYVAVGARPGFLLPLGGRFAISGELEVGVTVVRPQLLVDGRAAWTTPPVFGSAIVGALVAFGDGA